MEKMRDQANRRSRMLEEEEVEEDDTSTEEQDTNGAGANNTKRTEGVLSLGFGDLATVVNGRENEDLLLNQFDK
jgi:hypothetical protein